MPRARVQPAYTARVMSRGDSSAYEEIRSDLDTVAR